MCVCIKDRRGSQIPWNWSNSGCEPANMDAGNWTPVF